MDSLIYTKHPVRNGGLAPPQGSAGFRTQLDHIQAKYGEDDGFDCEYGWQGRGQFLICLQDEEAGNHGFQDSEDGNQPEAEPLTLPTLSNLAIVGAYTEGSRSGIGLRIRHFAGINLYNSVVQGWRLAGMDFRDHYGLIILDRCAFYDNEETCTGGSDLCTTLFEPPLQNLVAGEPVLVDPLNLEAPNLRGIARRLPAPLDPATVDEWFDSAPYVGAVPPEGEGADWTREPWISWRKQ